MATWYSIENEQTIDSPALLLYIDRVKHNIATAQSMVGDSSRLRPHVKTHKAEELVKLQLAEGIDRFKCATIAEAHMLGRCSAPDVLFAYPLVGAKIDRFLELVELFPDTSFSVIVDCLAAAQVLSRSLSLIGKQLPVFIDLNVGMGRTGILPGEAAIDLYRTCATMEGLCVQGFHAYDGHIKESDVAKRKAICGENIQEVTALCTILEEQGFDQPRIIMGGSPSFSVYAEYPEVECSPGTFILWDKGYEDLLPDQSFLPAAVVLTRIVSMPAPNRLCIELGCKAIASENPLDQRVFFLNAPELKAVGHSEEHMLLEAAEGHTWKIGDTLYAVPVHICPTVALYDTLNVVREGSVVEDWKVNARTR